MTTITDHSKNEQLHTESVQILRDKNEQLENEKAKLAHEVEELGAKVKWYEEQFRISQQKRFGASSDTVPPEQLSFINEAEVAAQPEAEEPVIETATRKRGEKRGINKEAFADLPVETIVYDLPEDEKECPICEGSMHVMKQEIRREIKVIPAQVSIVEHVRNVYACRDCQKDGTEVPIITAPMPAPVLPGSFASPTLLAWIMHQKYAAALPLYRQEQLLDHIGIEISRQNMANWIIKGADRWLSPLYERMRVHLLKETFLHADETPLRVLQKDGKPSTSTAYMWLYATGRYGPPMALYEYQPSRAGRHPKNFLSGFSGFLQSDGYQAYNAVENVTRVGCFAHARRGFTDALKALPKGADIESTHAHQALVYLKELFILEHKWTDLKPEERYKHRLEKSKPVLEAFLAWLTDTERKVIRKSALGKAIAYCLSEWKRLAAVLEDGQCELSNNRAERAIKPFVIGRKNFLFCKTANGARASAITYSIVESAKLNDLSPYHYLVWLFEQLPNIDMNDAEKLDAMMPWSKTIPKHIRKPS